MRSWFLKTLIGMSLILGASVELVAQKVSIDYEKGTDFSKLKSYAWVKGTPVANSNLDLYILNVTDGMLEKKGLHKVEVKDADLLITYHATGDSSLNISGFADPTYATVGGLPQPGQTVWSSPSTAGTTSRLIKKGQLAVQMLDQTTDQIVWTGTTAGTLKEKPVDRMKQVDKALDKLFAQFPPTAKK
jgi:hypothetical protein